MKRTILMALLVNLIAVGADMTRAASDTGPLSLVQTISLPGVEGRIDHMAVDVAGQRLFVAALGNNSVEVVDLKAGQRERSLTGVREPQGAAFVPAVNRLFVACGGDAAMKVFDGATYKLVGTISELDDADN